MINHIPLKRRLFAGILIAWLAVLAIITARAYLNGLVGDFQQFYAAAHAVRAGEDLYLSGSRGYIYPPLFAVLITPLSLLAEPAAGAAWAIAGAVMLLVAMRIAAREVVGSLQLHDDGALVPAVALLGFLPLADKAHSALSRGQTDALVLLLVVLGLRWTQRRPLLCGLAIAGAILIKYQALIFLPYFLFRRRWAEAAATTACSIGLALSTALVFGWERNLHYLRQALAVLGVVLGADPAGALAAPHTLSWSRSVSVPSAIARALGGESADLAAVGAIVGAIALAVVLIVLAMYRMRRVPFFAGPPGPGRARLVIEWSGLTVASVVFSPQTEARHMLLTAVMTMAAAAMVLAPDRPRARIPVAIALGILIAGLHLPPGGESTRDLVDAWRAVGGASWCMLACFLIVLWHALALCQSAPAPVRIRERDILPQERRAD